MNVAALRTVRIVAIGLILVSGLVWAAAGLGWFGPARAPSFGGPAIGSFRLVDQNGAAVTEQAVLGRPAVMFFGFTNCPDVCPTTLASMTALLGRLGRDADRLGFYFVTVDPERDTVAVLKAYLASFDPRIRGLTGAGDQIAAITRPLGVYYARVEAGGNYTMDHTASVFLVGADGTLRGTIAYGEDAAAAEAKLRDLLR